MPRHSHLTYEFYVRIVYTIFGSILTLAILAAFAKYSASGTAALTNVIDEMMISIPRRVIIHADSDPSDYPIVYMFKNMIPCATIGIIAAASSAIVTNLVLRHHNDVGTILTCIIHLGVDLMIMALTLAVVPKIAKSMGIIELYQR